MIQAGTSIRQVWLSLFIFCKNFVHKIVSHDLLIAKKMWFILAIVVVINKIYFAKLFNIIVE